MSSVVLQVGQCGNQVGQQFWSIVQKDKSAKSGCVYEHPEGYLRSINVDSEPKVIQKLISTNKLSIRPVNIKKGRRGRGTNWALGYHGTRYKEEDNLLESTLDSIRKEVERCSSFSGIVMCHSISGGTGSGLGSRLCENLRDLYPLSQILSCVVAPHTSGESPLQHYNGLLCLSWLQRYSDGVLWFHNDEILSRLQKRQTAESEKAVSFSSMNQHIAQCLAGLMLPTDTLTPPRGVSIGQEPWEMLRSVCPQPSLKFVHSTHLHKSKLTWDNLTGQLTHGVQRYNTQGETYRSLAGLFVARGDTTGVFPHYKSQVEAKLRSAYNFVNWNPFPVDYWTDRSNYLGPRDCASVTMASNHGIIADHLLGICEAARVKYKARAFLHWYSKYGCHQEDFEEAFDTVQDVVSTYQDAVS